MSGYAGNSGLSRGAQGIPPKLGKSNTIRTRPNAYEDLKPSEQKNSAGQRRVMRQQEKA